MTADWSWHYDWMLIGEEGDRPIVPGINTLRLDASGQPIAVHYAEGVRSQRQAMDVYARKTIFAVGGGSVLARHITGGFPMFPNLRILGLRKVSNILVDDVAASEYLERLERLVLRASGIEQIERLLASPLLESLAGLVVFDADLATLRAIAARSWPALRELRLLGPYPAHAAEVAGACAEELVRVFRNLRGRLRLFHVDRFVVPVDELVASTACETVEELGIERCRLRGGELLGALGELRELRASHSSFDDEAAMAIAQCARLEALELVETQVGNAGVIAIANAALPALRMLDVRETQVGDDAVLVLAKTETLPGLEQLRLPARLQWRTVIAGWRSKLRTVRDAVQASVPALADWVPRALVPDPGTENIATALWHRDAVDAYLHAIERGWWPPPPPGIARRFVFQTIEHCSVCRGSGGTPEGPCPYHVESQIAPRHDEEFPHAREVVTTIARTRSRFERAEALAVAFMNACRREDPRFPPIDTLVWHAYDAAWFAYTKVVQPPHAFRGLAPLYGYLAETALWPHLAVDDADARAKTDEERRAIAERPIGLAAAFTELGFWFHSLEASSLHLVMHGSLRNEP